jgi:thiamine biosynthesis lipoprotein
MKSALHLACVLLSLLFVACTAAPSLTTLQGRTMGTTWSVKLVAPAAVDIAAIERGIQAEVDRVVAQMSTYEADSDLSRFNRAPAGSWQSLPPEFFAVLESALMLAEDTDGAYDPTVAPLVDAWGFGPGSRGHRMPSSGEIAAARAHVGWRQLKLDPAGHRVYQPGGVRIDLSSIAKGFGTDQVARFLEREGVEHYLVDISGELRAHGRRPDGSDWRVAIEKPDAAAGAVDSVDQIERVVALREMSIATSGDYRHAFEHDGRRYSHHIDPRSGWPVEHRIASVSTLASDCMQADAVGTVMMVLGPEQGMAWAEQRKLAVLLIVRDGDALVERMSPAFATLVVP